MLKGVSHFIHLYQAASWHDLCDLLCECITFAIREGESIMAVNSDIIKGKWNQLKGEAKKQWGRLTDDEWDQIAGERDKLVGKLQEHYGWSREQAEREANNFYDRQSV